jgi:hypothetical protein
MQTGSIDEFIDAGIAFAGAPDNIFEQICEFDEHVDGLGHLLMKGQRGYLSYEGTVQNLTLFNQEVLPRLRVLLGLQLSNTTHTDGHRRRGAEAVVFRLISPERVMSDYCAIFDSFCFSHAV